MSKIYSTEFLRKLTDKMSNYTDKDIDKTLFIKLLKQKLDGEQPKIIDIEIEELEELAINELCSDEIIAWLYNTDVGTVRGLRILFDIDTDTINIRHASRVMSKYIKELEEELGEKAFVTEGV
ncbi:MAG: hypothetical protein IJ593_11550 [Lachnospiraceae bacterium]|nr:hypothetical protein [Lachnospiraceae bacterium]